MKKLSTNIKRALFLTTLSCASFCMMPTPLHETMSVCAVAEANDTQNDASAQESISQEMTNAFTVADY